MAKKHRGGQERSRPKRPTASTRTSTTGPAAPSRGRVDRRILAGIVAVVAVVLVGGVLALGMPRESGVAATPPPLAAVPAADIAVAEAARRWEEGALLLDVREADEWAAGHVPGAVHIPLSELSQRVAEVPTDEAVLVICRSGNRSQEGRDILLAAGHSPVSSVDGGVRAWRDAGLPYEGEVLG